MEERQMGDLFSSSAQQQDSWTADHTAEEQAAAGTTQAPKCSCSGNNN